MTRNPTVSPRTHGMVLTTATGEEIVVYAEDNTLRFALLNQQQNVSMAVVQFMTNMPTAIFNPDLNVWEYESGPFAPDDNPS